MAAPTGVGVVIPARDEAELLPRCLDALAVAIAEVDVPVHVVVVLDSCRDESAAIVAERAWATGVELEAGNVGAARAVGVDVLLRLGGDHRRDCFWIASTDADSVVPPDWLAVQLGLARDGWEATVGTVQVADWTGQPAHVQAAWLDAYEPVEHHPHVHGANLGLTAEAYVAVGGFRPLSVAEDVALVARLAGRRVIRTATHPVITSARASARAEGGFADHLSSLAG